MRRTSARFIRTFASAAVLVCVAASVSDAGVVAGKVLDSTTSLPLAGVEVLVDGQATGVTTDFMGQFKAEVAVGDHLFTFRRSGYSEQSQGPLAVAEAGETAVPEAKLAPMSAEDEVLMLDALTVQGELVKGSAGDLQNTRLKADVAIDFLSAEQLAKFSAGDLAEAVIRIPGVSVANGQFAVVRGLSDRYLSTTLAGLKLPSPDPEKQGVQLDLLPANAVGSIVVSKTFSSDLWAESGGGNLNILTGALPDEQIIKVGAGVKFNSNALHGGPDYEVGDSLKERAGFGADARPATGERSVGWQYIPTTRDRFPLGNKFSVEYANSFATRDDDKLGVSFGVLNETGTKAKSGTRQSFSVSPGSKPSGGSPGMPSGFEDPSIPLARGILFDSRESESESILGANAVLTYRFSPEHEIKLGGIFVQSGIDVSQINQNRIVVDQNLNLATQDGYAGFSGAEDRAWFKTYEYYRERNLSDVQLAGTHKFPDASDLGVSWAVQHAETYQKESPLIEATFATPLSDPFTSYELLGSNDAPDPLSIVWADNQESQDSGRLDFSLPRTLWGAEESTFKAGAATESTARDVQGDAIFFSNPSSTLSNSTPNGLYDELVSNSTTPTNSFSTTASAARDIQAAYVGASIAIIPGVKAVAGSRFEDYELSVAGTGQWGNYRSSNFYSAYNVLGASPSGDSEFRSKVWYPGVGLVLEPIKKISIRLHYSETSGRPSLREVSPFFNKSIETGNLVIGNPALRPSDVSSYDLRVEWNPTPADAVAVSVFRKDIRNPIEKVLFNTTAQTSEFTESWVNNPNTADLLGFEFELRHDLARWSDAFTGFSVGANFTWIDASVSENPYVIQRVENQFQDPDNIPRERRLFDQPEYIANVDLTWNQTRWGTTVTVAGYAISDVLETSGLLSSTYDLYERSTTRFDLIVSQRLTKNLKLKFSAKNLTDPIHGTVYDRDATEGTVARTRYRSGRDFSVSLNAEF